LSSTILRAIFCTLAINFLDGRYLWPGKHWRVLRLEASASGFQGMNEFSLRGSADAEQVIASGAAHSAGFGNPASSALRI
jgi:hypothetical protein